MEMEREQDCREQESAYAKVQPAFQDSVLLAGRRQEDEEKAVAAFQVVELQMPCEETERNSPAAATEADAC